MWVISIVVIKSLAKLPEHGAGVGPGSEARIVAFEGTHKGLGQAVGFWTRHWREARNQVELGGGIARVLGRMGLPVVGPPHLHHHEILGPSTNEMGLI